jgi:hypothetical protein
MLDARPVKLQLWLLQGVFYVPKPRTPKKQTRAVKHQATKHQNAKPKKAETETETENREYDHGACPYHGHSASTSINSR